MIERQPIRDTTAAIVSGDGEARKAQMLHYIDHVARHRALGIGRMVRRGRRTTASPIPAKICAHDGEMTGKERRHLSPHHVCLRKAVQQENGWSASMRTHEDLR